MAFEDREREREKISKENVHQSMNWAFNIYRVMAENSKGRIKTLVEDYSSVLVDLQATIAAGVNHRLRQNEVKPYLF